MEHYNGHVTNMYPLHQQNQIIYLFQTADINNFFKFLGIIRLSEENILFYARRKYPGLLRHIEHATF